MHDVLKRSRPGWTTSARRSSSPTRGDRIAFATAGGARGAGARRRRRRGPPAGGAARHARSRPRGGTGRRRQPADGAQAGAGRAERRCSCSSAGRAGRRALLTSLGLSPREAEVLQAMMRGQTTATIATSWGDAEDRLQAHREDLRKIGRQRPDRRVSAAWAALDRMRGRTPQSVQHYVRLRIARRESRGETQPLHGSLGSSSRWSSPRSSPRRLRPPARTPTPARTAVSGTPTPTGSATRMP